MNSQTQLTGVTVEISDSVKILENSELPGLLIVLCGQSISRHDLQILPADMVLVRSIEDFELTSFADPDAYLVLQSGLELAIGLLRSNRLPIETPVIWALGQPVMESLATLEAAGLPAGVSINACAGEASYALLVSGKNDGAVLDGASFRAGLRVARLTAPDTYPRGTAEVAADKTLQTLQRKHLLLLQTLEPAMEWSAPQQRELQADVEQNLNQATALEMLKLENELVLLKRRHDALERKYEALAKSHLGRMTLKIWDHRRRRALARNEQKELSV